jgi:hypothetical protein
MQNVSTEWNYCRMEGCNGTSVKKQIWKTLMGFNGVSVITSFSVSSAKEKA